MIYTTDLQSDKLHSQRGKHEDPYESSYLKVSNLETFTYFYIAL